jgi:serine phosphatase RsbU (regulator of sigma subunit)
VLDPAAGTLTYASAGHPSPLLRAADGSITMLTGGALPLGLRTRAQTPVSVTLPGSAFLVFYTDGLIEAGRDIIAGHERLLAAVARRDVVDSPNPAGALYQAVLGGSSSDDVVILTVTMLDRPR